MTATPLPAAVRAIIDNVSNLAEVAAIALGGSRAAESADSLSDHDIYVFVDTGVPHAIRRSLAARFDDAPEIGNSWFGEGDEWVDRQSGTSIDLMFWDRQGFEEQIRKVIEDHRPSLGYSTAFWFTLTNATPLYDSDGWFAGMQALAARPYPDELRRAIVEWNSPLLRSARSSYRHQIELACERDDPVSVHHRITELLASVFDIVFALHRQLHPGEKRLLIHVTQLGHETLEHRIREVLLASSSPAFSRVLPAVDALCDEVDRMILTHRL